MESIVSWTRAIFSFILHCKSLLSTNLHACLYFSWPRLICAWTWEIFKLRNTFGRGSKYYRFLFVIGLLGIWARSWSFWNDFFHSFLLIKDTIFVWFLDWWRTIITWPRCSCLVSYISWLPAQSTFSIFYLNVGDFDSVNVVWGLYLLGGGMWFYIVFLSMS